MDVHKTFPIFISFNLITKKNQGEKVPWLFLLGGVRKLWYRTTECLGSEDSHEHRGPQLSRDTGGQAPTSPPCHMEKNQDPSLK